MRWTIAVSLVVFLLVATSGRPWDLFARGGFTSDFFDAQARALLHGHFDVPASTAGIEGFAVRGRTYLYYGIVPALPRLPVVLFTDALDGRLVVLSKLVALAVALRATASLVWHGGRLVVRRDRSRRTETVVVAGLVGVVGLSSPFLFLASSPVVYHEVELWGAALALVAFDRLLAWWQEPSTALLVLTGVVATLALSTRGSVGLGPVVALALVLLDRVIRRQRGERLALLAATLAPVVVYALVNHARFGTWWSIPFDKQVLTSFGTDRQAALGFTHGSLFSLRYLPTAAVQYLRPDAAGIQRLFPWFGFGPRAHVFGGAVYDTVDRSSSITAAAPLLCLVAVVGLVHLLRHRHGTRIWWYVLAGTVVGVLVTWTIGFIANRYLSDVVPVLVVAAAPGAWVLAGWLARLGRGARRWTVAGLAVLGVWGLLLSTGQALLTEHLFLLVDPATRLGFVGFQHDLDNSVVGGHPYRLTLADRPPEGARSGDLLISDECAGLYWYDGTSWLPLERREGGGRLTVTEGRLPAGPFTLARGDGWRIDVEVSATGQRRFVYRADNGTEVPGPIVAIDPAKDLRLHLLADPVTTEVRLTADGQSQPLVNAFLVAAGGPVDLAPPFSGSVSPPGPVPPLCNRLLARAGRQ